MKRNAVSWAALAVAVVALVGSQRFSRPLPAAQDIPAEGQQVAKALSDAFGAVADFSKSSVVQINVEKKGDAIRFPGPNNNRGNGQPMPPKELEEMLKRFFGQDGFKFERQQFAAAGTGSGFVYDDKGHILTNNHVVQGADKITVTFDDGVALPATVVGTHPETDVAVIKVDSTEYRPLPRGQSSKLRVGEWVVAIGSPFGLDQTVTAGIISATQRNDVGINQFESFIQTDAAINPGNSGGPLLDMSGRVVGINSAIATASRSNSGVGFAIPIDMASRLADKLIKNGKIKPALLGIGISPVTPVLARQLGLDPKTHGVLVNEVGHGTPAEQAGIKVGDVITNFDGQPVFNRKDLVYLVSTSDVGEHYKLEILRDGKAETLNVTPGDAKTIYASLGQEARENAREDHPAEAPAVAKTPTDVFGLSLAPVDEELSQKYQYPGNASGLVVTEVQEGSVAAEIGIEPGDRLTKIVADHKIVPLTEVKQFEEVAKQTDEVSVLVEDVRKQAPSDFFTLVKPKADEKK
jgi:serine protease Do